MEQLKADMETDVSNADAAESSAISTYDSLMGDMDTSVVTLTESKGTLEGDVAADEETVLQETEARAATWGDLNATVGTLHALASTCDEERRGHGERTETRTVERTGLEEAKDALSAAER